MISLMTYRPISIYSTCVHVLLYPHLAEPPAHAPKSKYTRIGPETLSLLYFSNQKNSHGPTVSGPITFRYYSQLADFPPPVDPSCSGGASQAPPLPRNLEEK